MYRLRLLCRTTYEALAESSDARFDEIRHILLRMSETRMYLDGGASIEAFAELGDTVCVRIRQLV